MAQTRMASPTAPSAPVNHSWGERFSHAYHLPQAFMTDSPNPTEHVMDVILRGSFTVNYWGAYSNDTYINDPVSHRPIIPDKRKLYPLFNASGDPHDVHTIPFFRLLYAAPHILHIPGQRKINTEDDCINARTAPWKITLRLDNIDGMVYFQILNRSEIDAWKPAHSVPFDQVLLRMLFTTDMENHLGDVPYDWARDYRIAHDTALQVIPNHDEIYLVSRIILDSHLFATSKIFAKTLNPFTHSSSRILDSSAGLMMLAEREGIHHLPSLLARLDRQYPVSVLYGTVVNIAYCTLKHVIDKHVREETHLHLHDVPQDELPLLDFVALRYVCKTYLHLRWGIETTSTLPRLLSGKAGEEIAEPLPDKLPTIVEQLFPHALCFFVSSGDRDSIHYEYTRSALFQYMYHFMVTDPMPTPNIRALITKRVVELWLEYMAPYILRRFVITYFLHNSNDTIETQTADDKHYINILNGSNKVNELHILFKAMDKSLQYASDIDNKVNLSDYQGSSDTIIGMLKRIGANGSGVVDLVLSDHMQFPLYTHNMTNKYVDARLPYEKSGVPTLVSSVWKPLVSFVTGIMPAHALINNPPSVIIPRQINIPNKILIYVAHACATDATCHMEGLANTPTTERTQTTQCPEKGVYFAIGIGALTGVLVATGMSHTIKPTHAF